MSSSTTSCEYTQNPDTYCRKRSYLENDINVKSQVFFISTVMERRFQLGLVKPITLRIRIQLVHLCQIR